MSTAHYTVTFRRLQGQADYHDNPKKALEEIIAELAGLANNKKWVKNNVHISVIVDGNEVAEHNPDKEDK